MGFFERFKRGINGERSIEEISEEEIKRLNEILEKSNKFLINEQINPEDLNELIGDLTELGIPLDESMIETLKKMSPEEIQHTLSSLLEDINDKVEQSRKELPDTILKRVKLFLQRAGSKLAFTLTGGGLFTLFHAYGQQTPLPTAPDITQLPPSVEPHSYLPVAVIFLLGAGVFGIIYYFLSRKGERLSREQVPPPERTRFEDIDFSQLERLNKKILEDIRQLLNMLNKLKDLLLEQQKKQGIIKAKEKSEIIDKINEILDTLKRIDPNFENNESFREFILNLITIREYLQTNQESQSKPLSSEKIIDIINSIIENFDIVKSYFATQLVQIQDQYRHLSSEVQRQVGNIQANVRQNRGITALSGMGAALLLFLSISTAVYHFSRDPLVAGYERGGKIYREVATAAEAEENYHEAAAKALEARLKQTETAVKTKKEENLLLKRLEHYLAILVDQNHPIHSFLIEAAEKEIKFETLEDLLGKKTELSKAQQKFLEEHIRELNLRIEAWKAEREKFLEMLRFSVLTKTNKEGKAVTAGPIAEYIKRGEIERAKQELERLKIDFDKIRESLRKQYNELSKLRIYITDTILPALERSDLSKNEKERLEQILNDILDELINELTFINKALNQFENLP